MDGTKRGAARSDALVLFGVTGDLAHKKIFPALYAMAKRGALDVPVVGVATSKWSLAQLRKRVRFQIVALLAMEPPAYRGYGAVHDEKNKVFQAMRPLRPADLVRGQYAGYRKEPGVAKNSDVETFCALRLFIDSWRWEGVPWYLRSGKCLAETAAEVIVQLKPPPQRLFQDSAPATGAANYLRFRLSPSSAVALAARVKRAGKEFLGDQRELYLLDEQPDREAPYERLLGDAMAGDGALFTREDAIDAAWAVVEPVLESQLRVLPYRRHSWGPRQADALIAADGSWHNPMPCRA